MCYVRRQSSPGSLFKALDEFVDSAQEREHVRRKGCSILCSARFILVASHDQLMLRTRCERPTNQALQKKHGQSAEQMATMQHELKRL